MDENIYIELDSPSNVIMSKIISPETVPQEDTDVRRHRVRPNIWLIVSAIFITALVSAGLTYTIAFLMDTTKSSDKRRLNTTCILDGWPLNTTDTDTAKSSDKRRLNTTCILDGWPLNTTDMDTAKSSDKRRLNNTRILYERPLTTDNLNKASSNTCKHYKSDFKNSEALGVSSQCPDSWYKYSSGCYFKVKEKKTWFEAQDFCRSKRSNLLSFHSRDELTTVTGRYLSDPNYYWIGLQDHDQDNNFEWSDGTPLDFTNWHPYEPNRWNGVENCVVLYEDNSWNDANCYLPFYFVCKTVITTRCGNGDWIYFNNSCYMFNTRVATWGEARLSCLSNGANLAVIPTQHELNFLLSQMLRSSHSKFPVWIGLRRQVDGKFGWIDGTVDNSFPWSRPEQSFSCVGVDRYGNFFSTGCEAQSGFICEKVL